MVATTNTKTNKRSKKSSPQKKKVNTKVVKKTTQKNSKLFSKETWWKRVLSVIAHPFVTVYRRLRYNRKVSPHKSFQRTRRRDLPKKPKVEGYIAFPAYVMRTIWQRKWLYIRLILVFIVLSALTLGTAQMANMGSVNEIISIADEEMGSVLDPAMKAFTVVASSLGGALNANITEMQSLALFALVFFMCITVVWLVRQQLAGNKVNVRDGLYSSGAPIVSLYALVAIGILQLIPVAIAALVYSAAVSGGILTGGIDTMLFSFALFFAVVLTLYFMTTTLFAMFISTIPGTYPLKAYQTARQIVSGQRARLLFRLIWMAVIIVFVWFLFLVPVVIIVSSFNGQDTIIIPIAVQLVTGFSLVYGSAYAYLLYRRMIDDPAKSK